MRAARAYRFLVGVLLIACGGATNEDSERGAGDTADEVDAVAPATSTSSAAPAPAPAAKPPCPWDVDALLRQVGALVLADRVDCGYRSDCFAAAPVDPGAQFTENNCIDCSIPTTYVSEPGPAYFAVTLEADQYGDAFREARVDRCREIQITTYRASCTYPEQLYSCKEPLSFSD